MVPLSVLDLSPVTTGTPGAAGAAQQPRSRPPRRPAGLHPLLGGRAPQHAQHRKLGARHHDRADRRGDRTHLRVGSGGVMLPNHAPLQVAERYKVLEGLFPGPHRSRARPRARHRSGDLLRAAAAAGRSRRRRFPRPLPGAAGVRAAAVSRKAIRSAGAARCPPMCRCRRSICSARPAIARSSPPMSAPDSRSRTISPTSTRSCR